MSERKRKAGESVEGAKGALQSENVGAVDSTTEVQSTKSKKSKKTTQTEGLVASVSGVVEKVVDAVKSAVKDEITYQVPSDAISPLAQPLAARKLHKKLIKCTKKANKQRCLKRGVKEVVKVLKKPAAAGASTIKASTSNQSIVILAANISPMDVLSHIPVLCEEAGIPYVWIESKEELGAYAGTQRPTSVVLVQTIPQLRKQDKDAEKINDSSDMKEYLELFQDVFKEVQELETTIDY